MMNNKSTHTPKVALVGTPCHIIAAAKMNKFSDYLGESPIDIKIGLFCMENFSYSYLKKLLEDRGIDLKDIREFRVEKNHLWLYLTQDKVHKIPLDQVKSCIRKNCMVCMDYTSELSDLSIGSVGSPPGWSTVIVRTSKGKEILDKAVADNYIKIKKISDSGLKILDKLARKKKKENKEEIRKRENIARPVLYRRYINEEEFWEEVADCQFKDLKNDVIDIGSCVLCGACMYICPENIVSIEDRKPEIQGNCPEGCNLCYIACPRTYIPTNLLDRDWDWKPLGDYLQIVSVKAPLINGQDGGVATALLNYVLSQKMVDEVIVVDQSTKEPWKPEAKLTHNLSEVLKAAGTKYAACPVFKPLDSKPREGTGN